jgi:hypothetical protein
MPVVLGPQAMPGVVVLHVHCRVRCRRCCRSGQLNWCAWRHDSLQFLSRHQIWFKLQHVRLRGKQDRKQKSTCQSVFIPLPTALIKENSGSKGSQSG